MTETGGEKVEKERKESGLLENISIVWPRWVRNIVDNIACDGQCVCIPRGRYSKISLIGSAEFGNSSDILLPINPSIHIFAITIV